MLAVIFGRNRDKSGREGCFIQILTEKEAYRIDYPIQAFFKEERYFYVRIGKNYVTCDNLYLDIEQKEIEQKDIKIKGCLHYGKFTQLSYPIMGPFEHLPDMECHHGILSMRHAVRGSIRINGRKLSFAPGIGYAEKDSGCSFPKSYIWTQCNTGTEVMDGAETGENVSIVSAVAVIPYHGIRFTGTITVIGYQGKLYRMATYLGTKVLCQTSHLVVLVQGTYLLVIRFLEGDGLPLSAPQRGDMQRTVEEVLQGRVEYTFCIKGRELFRVVSRQASVEIAVHKASDTL